MAISKSIDRKYLHFSRNLLFYTLIFVASFLYFSYLSLNRYVAWDEGFYAYAAKLVSEDKTPYLDFFYPQMPLLPYAYSIPLLFNPFESNWEALRLFTGVLSAISATFVSLILNKKTSKFFALIGTIGFCCLNNSIIWLSTVKSYPLTVATLLGSIYLLLDSKSNNNKFLKIFLAGFLLGLSTTTRLYIIVLIPIFGIHLLAPKAGEKSPLSAIINNLRKDLSTTIYLLLGFSLAFALPILLIFLNFESFWFNNVSYHNIRSQHSFWDELPYKRNLVLNLFSIKPTAQFIGYEYAIIFILSFIIGLVKLIFSKKIDLMLLIGATIFLVSFIPVPSYIQYFCIPIFILFIYIFTELLSIKNKAVKTCLTSLFCFSILAFSTANINLYTNPQIGLQGIKRKQDIEDKSLSSISKLSNKIATFSHNNDLIWSYWPGYLLDTKASSISGGENHFSYRIGDRITKEQKSKFKLLSENDVKESISNSKPKIVVLPRRQSRRKYNKNLEYGKYESIHAQGLVEIYSR